MKVIFSGEVIGIVKHENGSFASNIRWKRGKWANESIYIDAKLELGQRVEVIVDTEPASLGDPELVTIIPSEAIPMPASSTECPSDEEIRLGSWPTEDV